MVNPTDADYSARQLPHNPTAWRQQWDNLKDTTSQYENTSLTKEALGDDYPKLFVNIVLERARQLVPAYKKRNPFSHQATADSVDRDCWHR